MPGAVAAGRARTRGRRPPPRSGDRGGEVLVELEEVMGGRDQSPFGPGGGSAASGEAGESAVVFGVTEDRFDELFALSVELVAAFFGQRGAHEVIGAAGPARTRRCTA